MKFKTITVYKNTPFDKPSPHLSILDAVGKQFNLRDNQRLDTDLFNEVFIENSKTMISLLELEISIDEFNQNQSKGE